MKRAKYSGNPPQKDYYLPKQRWTTSPFGFKGMLTAWCSWLGCHLKLLLLLIGSCHSSTRAFCSMMQPNMQLSNCVGSHCQGVWRQVRPRETNLQQQFFHVQKIFVHQFSLENTFSMRNKELWQQGRAKRTWRCHPLYLRPELWQMGIWPKPCSLYREWKETSSLQWVIF